jgi:hypothetical protein
LPVAPVGPIIVSREHVELTSGVLSEAKDEMPQAAFRTVLNPEFSDLPEAALAGLGD